ncbi:hypothetical protein D9X30_4891 [Cupriavidus sp. U2]|uniref:hypothetical protein n=1 Tax=Cupriavidus sp. U2 TaxID=2920269 RepID=UPI00129DE439|nr:hypothetical protein [Cupriavidus sp. U2]KAI3589308.1 hypothetical protein D9X30_4891 [Cupriavidus sp. U2]
MHSQSPIPQFVQTDAGRDALAELRAMTTSEPDPFGRTWNLHIDPRERRFWIRAAYPNVTVGTVHSLAAQSWRALQVSERAAIKSAVRRVASRAALLLSDPLATEEEN